MARTRTFKRGGAPLPNAPYTPVLERVRLDYSASTTLRPVAQGRSELSFELHTDPERLLHIHPFGVSELRPDADTRYHGLLPPLGPDGNLCIGLKASALEGALSLLFHLREDGVAEPRRTARRGQAADPRRDPVQWFYLAQNRWRKLAPHQVLADTTQGFLTSGVVTLDLKRGARDDNTVLSGGLYWLRAASNTGLDSAAPLVSVHAQAVTLVRELAPEVAQESPRQSTRQGAAARADTALPAGLITQPALNLPGLAGVLQLEPSSGLRLAEDERQLQIRAGERLRHKGRASLAWDVERLVLERFPAVFKVKCFSAHELPPGAGLARGTVLVVVVPNARRNHPADSTLAPRLNARALQDIEDYLVQRASPFARPQVRNATYERVQVRCRLALERSAQAGVVMRRVQRVLTEYLSPWHDAGYGPRFEWVLRCDDVEAQVRGVPGVAAVGQLSLLHVARSDEGFYRWGDTARPGLERRPGPPAAADAPARTADQLQHRAPWSLALPLPEHLLELPEEMSEGMFEGMSEGMPEEAPGDRPAGRVAKLKGGAGNKPPQPTGLSKLRVGSTIVIGGSTA